MDVQLYETGNGGDLLQNGKDISVINGLLNMPYLGMFGGNVESSTPNKRLSTEQAFDWWGNSVDRNDKAIQNNSETERSLLTTPLTSAGRIQIEQAVKKDLQFMKELAEIEVKVSIINDDVVQIFVGVKQPNNTQSQNFTYFWDATAQELAAETPSPDPGTGTPSDGSHIFDDPFGDPFE